MGEIFCAGGSSALSFHCSKCLHARNILFFVWTTLLPFPTMYMSKKKTLFFSPLVSLLPVISDLCFSFSSQHCNRIRWQQLLAFMSKQPIITKFSLFFISGFRLGNAALQNDEDRSVGSARDSVGATERNIASWRVSTNPVLSNAEKPSEGEARIQLDQKLCSVSQRHRVWNVGRHVSRRKHSND